MSRPETQSRLGKCVQLQNKILIEKQSTQKSYIFSLGVKPALKICIQQGQVIIYRNFTTRRGTFFSLKKVLSLVLSVSRPETQSRLGKCVQLQNKILIEKQSTQKPYIFFPRCETCPQNLYTTRSSYNLSKFHHWKRDFFV